jgi:signal peptidase I
VPPEATTYTEVQPLRMVMETRGRSRRRRGTARIASTLLLGCAVVLVLAAVLAMSLGLVRFTVVDSGSMRPTLNPGDVVLLRSERPTDVSAGQIVAFHPPGEPRVTVIHRIRSIEHARHDITIRTKGDANNAADPWRATIAGSTVWREDLTLPWVGYLVAWGQQPAIRLGVLGIMLALALGISLSWIWRPGSR